jgi:DNA-binding MarR family transcriptional regulator
VDDETMGSMAYGNLTRPERSTALNPDSGFVPVSTGASANAGAGRERKAIPQLVRAIQAARRRRDALFAPELFADPAWDMLLELYALHLEQKRVSVSSLCIAAYVPPTTALRWVAKLEEERLATRTEDPMDGRRTWIELSAVGIERMERYFEMLPLAAVSI